MPITQVALVEYADRKPPFLQRTVYPAFDDRELDDPREIELHSTIGVEKDRPVTYTKVPLTEAAAAKAALHGYRLEVPWTQVPCLLCGWAPSPDDVISAALELAEVGSGDVFYDLGAGDGRVLKAAEGRGATAVGLELDAHQLPGAYGDMRAVDLLAADINDATVVYAFLGDEVGASLALRLSGRRQGTRIVTFETRLGGWLPTQERGGLRLWVV